MNKATVQPAELIRGMLDGPARGIPALVDDLLAVCQDHDLQLDWQMDRLRVRSPGGDWEELGTAPLGTSAFRAVLARIAVLCNERTPQSVSPYGGQGRLSPSADSTAVFRVSFANTPGEQRLELTSET